MQLLVRRVVRGVQLYSRKLGWGWFPQTELRAGSGLLSLRQNWIVRTTMCRYTRVSDGFSRKLENHAAATALNYSAYNFIKIHRTLRVSPAMAAGVTDRLWDVNDPVALWEAYEQRRAERAA
jgi:hypothetical protein